MKKILLSLLVLAVIGITAKVQAQCTVSNVVVDINTCNAVSGNLQVNFDVSFKIANNNGNKYIFIHSWKASQYPNYWNCSVTGTSNENKPPKNTAGGGNNNTALANSFLNIAIDNNLANNGIALVTTYSPDPANVTITPVTGISKVVNGDGSSTITLTGVAVTIPGVTSCNDPISVISDVWSSQASDGQVVHCVNCNIKQFFNDPVVTALKNCLTPRKISFGVVTNGNVPASFTYQIYRDFAPLGVFDGNDVNVTLTAPNADVITVNTAGSGGQVSRQVGFTGDNTPGENSDYWVVVTPQSGGNSIAKLAPNLSCIPLPVDMISFDAARTGSIVKLKWETMSEQNCRGFAVERNTGNNNWQEVGFVPSRAVNGNSADLLAYQFTDNNDSKSLTQYRIRQVDNDNRNKYSQVRSVRGIDQKGGIIVYPNPTNDGKVSVVFEDKNVIRDISLTDMSGRVVKQMKGISNNNIVLENLNSGMYTLRVYVPATGDQTAEKIIVNRK